MSLIRKIKYHIEFAVYLFIEFIFGAIPLEAVSTFSGKGWRLFAPLSSRHQRAIDNLRAAFPEWSRAHCDAVARDMWENLGRNFGEFFHLDEIYASDRVDATATSDVSSVLHGKAPGIACAAHQSNWEVTSMGPVKAGFRPVSIYRRMSNPYVDARVLKARAPYYPGGLMPKGAAAGARALRSLKKGGELAILADLRDSVGVAVPFFGRPAPSTPFPARAALILGVPLIAVLNERLPGVRFKITFEKIDVRDTGDTEADVVAATAALQAVFERSIRAHPEQWMWAHRRWD